MQSADGTLHLIPALPDVWLAGGKVSGLRARGGFEITDMEWKDGKIIKTVIRSTLGGNLRLRIPNEMKLNNGAGLKIAVGENTNPFYETEVIRDPVISEKAIITAVVLSRTFLYDILTKPGQILTLISK